MTLNWIMGIPAATDNPSESQPDMLANNNILPDYLAVDHIRFGEGRSGYHKVVHLTNQPTPANESNVGTLYATTMDDGIQPDEVLFYQTGGGRIMQMTRNFTPKIDLVTKNGATFLPGGLILNWGQIQLQKNSDNPTPISFAQKYSNVFSVTNGYGPHDSSTTAQAAFIFDIVTTGFKVDNTSSSSTRMFYWMAIGN